MRGAARWGTLLAALVLWSSVPAHAADERATREAEARFVEGLARVKSKDYEAARLSFAQAYVVLKKPVILWNLALSEEKSGHTLDAIGHFRQVVHDASTDADRANAQRHIDVLLTEVGRIDAQAPAGSAFVLDGGDLPDSAPLAEPLDVSPGHHVIEVKLPHGATKSSVVDAVAGQIVHVSFTADAPAPAAPAAIATSVPRPTSASAEGQGIETTPDVPRSSRAPSGAKIATTVTLAGIAVVAVGFGAYFAIQSQNDAKTALNYRNSYGKSGCAGSGAPTDCAKWNEAVQGENRDTAASDVLYIAGGALAAGAILTWLLWPNARTPAAWVSPSFAPTGMGFEAGGRF